MIKKFGFHLPELCSTFSYYYCKTQSIPWSIENCFIFNPFSSFLCPSVSCSSWCFCLIVYFYSRQSTRKPRRPLLLKENHSNRRLVFPPPATFLAFCDFHACSRIRSPWWNWGTTHSLTPQKILSSLRVSLPSRVEICTRARVFAFSDVPHIPSFYCFQQILQCYIDAVILVMEPVFQNARTIMAPKIWNSIRCRWHGRFFVCLFVSVFIHETRVLCGFLVIFVIMTNRWVLSVEIHTFFIRC